MDHMVESLIDMTSHQIYYLFSHLSIEASTYWTLFCKQHFVNTWIYYLKYLKSHGNGKLMTWFVRLVVCYLPEIYISHFIMCVCVCVCVCVRACACVCACVCVCVRATKYFASGVCSTARISRGRFPVEAGRFISKQGVSTTTKHSHHVIINDNALLGWDIMSLM